MYELAPCTPEHLCKTFRKSLNKTPSEFTNELKVQTAATLLAESNDKIQFISVELGYRSQSYFYHSFKEYYGMTPAKFREKIRISNRPI
ncbi:MAG: helix-turn-helix transcriptional regulator [Verrucomicrobiota bacterium]|nr:helix-turn-helix transcriptional regulator [Verrucomicrobiota bacterium]